ncbi:Potassium transporter 1 [Morella rubra]|uniref:Potassium transporter 1 n=1 Tax=Morella rubra TaxID=262757 RepID=A0A6A1WSH3_9ROSI|nr:Potassium transporter 1 [Morella rubra]
MSRRTVLMLAYQSLGVVYGDLSISPLYVYKTTFSGKLSLNEDDEEIFGVLSFIFWTITLIALFKYVFIVMSADDNGEGGTFALYSLLCRHAGLGILPNHQAVDESLPAYFTEASADTWQSSVLKSFLEKHPRFRTGLLIFVLLGTCMAIGDGVLTPAISDYVVIISCVILVGLFSLQHNGTHRVAFLFAPIVTAWLLCLTGIGVYNIFQWNPHIYRALSPTYMLKLLKTTSVEGWVSLGGVVLAITGATGTSFTQNIVSGVEAMFANLGHFSPLSIKMAFTFLVYPSLLLTYMAVTIGLRDTNRMGHAYGLAVTTVMFVTTCLMALVMIIVWKQKIITAVLFLLSFGSMELLYISACIFKVPEGAWIALIMSSGFMAVMYIWYYGTMKKHQFDVENKISINRIVAFGPSLGMVRVPGIGLVYTNLVTGVPAIFGHFVTNLPAFHQVLVFVCIKSVQVPYVGETERILISRVGPKECGMYRCILRYGYKDLHQETYNFENRLVSGLVHFVETEEEKSVSKETLCSTEEEDNVRSSLDGQVMTSGFGQVESFLLKDESLHILKAKESGVTYIFGHSYAKAKKSSPVLKKFVVNVVYAFLSKNCTDPNVLVNVSPTSLLEVGMIYYV